MCPVPRAARLAAHIEQQPARGGQQEPLPRPPQRIAGRVPLLGPVRHGLLRADNHKVLRAFVPFNNSRGAGLGKIRQGIPAPYVPYKFLA